MYKLDRLHVTRTERCPWLVPYGDLVPGSTLYRSISLLTDETQLQEPVLGLSGERRGGGLVLVVYLGRETGDTGMEMVLVDPAVESPTVERLVSGLAEVVLVERDMPPL